MPVPIDLLILEADISSAERITGLLQKDLTHKCVSTIPEAESILNECPVRLLLCADDLPEETGLMFLVRTQELWPGLKRVLMAPDIDGELFFHAMKEVRLFSYLNKPVDRGEIQRTIHHALLPAPPSSPQPPTGPEPDTQPAPGWLSGIASISTIALACLVSLLALLILYELKSFLGIDIFPDWHLRDLFVR